MKPSLKFTLLPLAVAGSILVTGCGKGTPDVITAASASDPATTTANPPANPLEIEVSPDLHLEIKVGEPRMRPISATLSVAGRVEADETRMIRVSAHASGRIVELNVIKGQQVEKGQVVAAIHSTELAQAQSEFLKETTAKQQADRAVARAKQLLDAGVISSAEQQRREAEAVQVGTQLAFLRKQLSVMGMSDEAIQKLETTRVIDSQTYVLAAASGLVLERNVTQGQVVQTAEPLCVIADLSSLWLVADVPEEHARALRMGKRVQAEIPALPGEKFSGLVSYVGATVHPETRTITARMDLANPQHRFKPQMLATMLLMDNPEQRMVVPLESVVRDGNDESIFVQVAPNRYRLQKVTLGEETESGRVVLSGLPSGTKIVTEGAFHLNNERRRQSGGAELASE